jgi:hypothetical protein
VLPLDRTAYVAGEKVPLAFRGTAGDLTLALVDRKGTAWPLYTGKAQPLVLDTTWLAEGDYQVQLDGSNAVTLSVRGTLRESPMSLVDESGPDPKQAYRPALKETGITALFWPSHLESGCRRQTVLDDCTPSATMGYINPTTRPSSFNPPRAGEDELSGFRMRLAAYAQANARYPTFGGFWYDWDGASMFGYKGMTRWFGVGERLAAFRNWSDRRDQAVYDLFKQRTGLEGVKDEEFFRYCLARGRPEFASNIDYVTFKLSRELAKSTPPMAPAEIVIFERRLDAWNHFLMNLWGEAYAGHQSFLREVLPGLRNTTSMNVDHGAVRVGHWEPAYTVPLDFRYMSAWNDQSGSPDYSYQWLFTVGLLEIGRKPGQPIWISSALSGAHGLSPYPGKFMREAGHGLTYGLTGLGNAGEGFSSLFGMSPVRYPAIKEDASRWQDLVAGREFLKRFSALGEQSAPWRRVAVLYSEVQMGRQEVTQGLHTPQFATFTALVRLGYQPRFITEDMIAGGDLASYGALVIINQSEPLPRAVLDRMAAFAAGGGRLFKDQSSTIEIPNATPMEVALPYAHLGAPHNWTVINLPDNSATEWQEKRLAEVMPKFHAALGDAFRTPLMSSKAGQSKASTLAMDGGKDATYVVAVNDLPNKNQADWVQFSELLVPNQGVTGVVYDLTREESLGPVGPVVCSFTDLTVHVYGILSRSVSAIDLAATQALKAGEVLQLRLRFLDSARQPLQAAIPFELSLRNPDGTVAASFYRSTDRAGEFALVWPVPLNAPTGTWSVDVRSQLDGQTVALPVEVKPGKRLDIMPLTDRVIARGSDSIGALLATKPSFVLPLFDGPRLEERRAAAAVVKTVLAKRGVEVEIREKPAMTTYLVSYDPSPVQIKENTRALQGETIGVVQDDYEGYLSHFGIVLTRYVSGTPLILLDWVGEEKVPEPETAEAAKAKKKQEVRQRANPMAAVLSDMGMLWPAVSAEFPGEGRATLQMVKSAFGYRVDTLVIQSMDLAGLKAGAEALSKLPTDWVGVSVARAREALLGQFGIGVTPLPVVNAKALTSRKLTTGRKPQPLAIVFGHARPPTVEQVAAAKASARTAGTGKPAPVVPGELKPAQFEALYLLDGQFIDTLHPLAGDCRFLDAMKVSVDVKEGGTYTMVVEGVFRYSDRRPQSQGGWEVILKAYNALPKERKPMTIEVQVDGKTVGSLATLTTVEKEVSTQIGTKETVKEEVVTKIAGRIELPQGSHEIRLIHHHMVDGLISKVTTEFSAVDQDQR